MPRNDQNRNNGARWPAPGTSGGGPSIPASTPVRTRTNGKQNDNGKVW